jgi:hypothetical protein
MTIGELGRGVESRGLAWNCLDFSQQSLPRVWIPAFAGMTAGGGVGVAAKGTPERLAEALMRVFRLRKLSSGLPTISCGFPRHFGWKSIFGAGVGKPLRMTIAARN